MVYIIMRGTTKTFIETNIDLIEQQDWLTLFQGWYDIAYGEVDTDAVRFDDLMETLYEAGVSSLKETLEARKQVIRKDVELIIQDWIDNIDDWTGAPGWIGMRYITHDQLRSYLGLDISVIKDIIKDVAISKDLVPDRYGEGFRMRRFI